jgi:Intracellular proteinase inhibitor
MNARLVQFILVAAALAYIGVARTHLTAAPPSLATGTVTPYASAGRVERASRKMVAKKPPITLTSSLGVAVDGESVVFDMTVTNPGQRKVELTFPSGQTYDVVVYDAAGGEVWRWSTGQMFTQSLRNKSLDAHETMSYSATWKHPAIHGSLVAVATLTSTNYPSTARVTFALP